VIDFLAQEFRKRTLAQWDELLATLDVCYGRVNTLPEGIAHANLHARGMVKRDEAGRMHIGAPVRFRDEPAVPVLREPRLGEHTEAMLESISRVPAGG
jgi:crotonobetainyl-CoA:carnitine CoA-transferase CaiB-like acyl-CoA transferase